MVKTIGYAIVFNGVMFGAALVGLLVPGGEAVAVGVIGFCLGAAIGSFLNLLVYRLRTGLRVTKLPSHCPKCRAQIKDRHNIPVFGWLWLRGRCASCRDCISWHYPVAEFAAGCVGAVAAIGIVLGIA